MFLVKPLANSTRLILLASKNLPTYFRFLVVLLDVTLKKSCPCVLVWEQSLSLKDKAKFRQVYIVFVTKGCLGKFYLFLFLQKWLLITSLYNVNLAATAIKWKCLGWTKQIQATRLKKMSYWTHKTSFISVSNQLFWLLKPSQKLQVSFSTNTFNLEAFGTNMLNLI